MTEIPEAAGFRDFFCGSTRFSLCGKPQVFGRHGVLKGRFGIFKKYYFRWLPCVGPLAKPRRHPAPKSLKRLETPAVLPHTPRRCGQPLPALPTILRTLCQNSLPMLKIEAFQIAEQINIKRLRTEFTGEPFFSNNHEIFYVQENGKYLYVLSYGVVVFANQSEIEKSDAIRFFKNFCERPIEGDFKEDLVVEVNPERKLTFSYTSLVVPEINENAVRIIMLNTAQSVALELYEALGDEILEDARKFGEQLEKIGKIKISRANLLKFIGRTLNVKNSIIDNLYIFNSPDTTWEQEYLSKLDHGLREMFDINTRFRALDYQLRIVEDNLKLFTDLSQNRESNRLELIVIGLILIEVLDLVFGKIFNWGH